MKIDNIKKMINITKHIYLMTPEDGCQWVSNGMCAVPLYGLPKLRVPALYKLFSISEENEYKYYITEAEGLPFSTEDKHDNEFNEVLEYSKLNIVYKGREYSVFETREGTIFIKSQYIALFGNLSDGISFVRRGNMIVVFDGVSLMGYITPIKIKEELCESIQMLADNVERAVGNRLFTEHGYYNQLELDGDE